jgi:hypothetical protein
MNMREWLKKICGPNMGGNIVQNCQRLRGQRAQFLCRLTSGSVAMCLLAGLAACGQAPQEAPEKPKLPTTYTPLNGEYIKTATMTCGDATVQTVIRCKKEPTYPAGRPMYCSDQYFVFRRAGKETVVRPGKKVQTDIKPGRYHLLPKAASWLCAKGKDQYYLYVVYGQDGNCDTCEWSQIYDLSGKPMIDLTRNRRTDDEWPQIMEKRPIDGIVQSRMTNQVLERLSINIPRGSFDDSTTIPISRE